MRLLPIAAGAIVPNNLLGPLTECVPLDLRLCVQDRPDLELNPLVLLGRHGTRWLVSGMSSSLSLSLEKATVAEDARARGS